MNTFELDISPVAKQFVSWEDFYLNYFGVEMGDVKISTPVDGFGQLIVVPNWIIINWVVGVMRELGIKVLLCVEDLDANVTINDRDPKNGGYTIWVRGQKEADKELREFSADQIEKQSIKGITLLERLLYGFKYLFETGEHLDFLNWTLCTGSRFRDGNVPTVGWLVGSGELAVCRASSLDVGPSLCARAASF